MQFYNWGWVGLPLGVFLVVREYFLYSGELWLLVYTNVMLFSTLLPQWITQITHLIMISSLSTHVFIISKQSYGIISEKKYSLLVRILMHLEEELSILVYMISAWLTLRKYTDKSQQFGIGHEYSKDKVFYGVSQSLCGWNCTQLEFTLLSGFWFILNVLSLVLGKIILKVQRDKDNLYKEYVLHYLVKPYILFSLIAFLHNLYSYLNAKTLFDCVKYWEYGFLMQVSVYYGFSFSTFYFFYIKKGVFLVKGDSESENNEYPQKPQVGMGKNYQ